MFKVMPISTVNDSLCFKLNLATRLMTGLYKPYLSEMNLTFPQFLVLGLLWEQDNQTIKSLGEKLYLDSGTLTPLVKRLEKAELLVRKRDEKDERSNIISLTEIGQALKVKAITVAEQFYQNLQMDEEEQQQLNQFLSQWINRQLLAES